MQVRAYQQYHLLEPLAKFVARSSADNLGNTGRYACKGPPPSSLDNAWCRNTLAAAYIAGQY